MSDTQKAKIEKLNDKLAERVFMYSVFRRVFVEPPNEEVVELLQDPEVKTVFKSKGKAYKDGVKLLEAFYKLCKKQKLDAAQEASNDYIGTYTFGKNQVYPYESTYVSKKKWLFQDSTVEVRNSYFDEDLAPKMLFSDPDDHIGLELDFLRLLAERALAAMEKSDIVKTKELVEKTAHFLVNHPSRWFGKFAEQTSIKAKTDFYRAMSMMVAQYVLDDVEDLKKLYLDLQKLSDLDLVVKQQTVEMT